MAGSPSSSRASLTPPVTITGTDPATVPLSVDGANGQVGDVFYAVTFGGDGLEVQNDGSVRVLSASSPLELRNQTQQLLIVNPLGGIVAHLRAATEIGILLTAAAAQSRNIIELDSDAGDIIARFDKDGRLGVAVPTAPADGDVLTGEGMLWFDRTNGAGNTKLMVKGKSADGTVKTASILLA